MNEDVTVNRDSHMECSGHCEAMHILGDKALFD